MKVKDSIYTNLFIILFTASIVFTGCGGNKAQPTGTDPISKSDDYYLRIIQDNTIALGERFTVYSYPRDQLSSDQMQAIDNLTTTTENLHCVNDGVTYEIKIMDQDGKYDTYVSNNRDCGREFETQFISVDDIKYLISILE